MKIGDKLKRIREIKGLKQEDIVPLKDEIQFLRSQLNQLMKDKK
jgi:hypothetical protein